MTARRLLRAGAVIQYALIGIMFLAIVAFWAIITQEQGSKNLIGVKVTWEELVAAQSAKSNDGGGK